MSPRVRLTAVPAGHLFKKSTTKLVLPRHLYLRQHTYEFIEMCGRHWTRFAVAGLAAASWSGSAPDRDACPVPHAPTATIPAQMKNASGERASAESVATPRPQTRRT